MYLDIIRNVDNTVHPIFTSLFYKYFGPLVRYSKLMATAFRGKLLHQYTADILHELLVC